MSKNKYGAIPTIVRNEWFHSKLEASFYIPLLNFCKYNNLIMERQVRYELYRVGKKVYHYVSDFTIKNDYLSCIVDAKGAYPNPTSKRKINIVMMRYAIPVYVGSSISKCLNLLKAIFVGDK